MNNIKTIQGAVDELKRAGFRVVTNKAGDPAFECVFIIVRGCSVSVFDTFNTDAGFKGVEHAPMEVNDLIAAAEKAEQAIYDKKDGKPAPSMSELFIKDWFDCNKNVNEMIALGWVKNTSADLSDPLEGHFPKPSMMAKPPQ